MARDVYHNVVRQALEQEGWIITHDPLRIKHRGLKIEIDLGAEKVIGAEKEGRMIAVEIKSFLNPSIFI